MDRLGGIFVGGEGKRMGGVVKALLQHDGRTLVERWIDLMRSVAVTPLLVEPRTPRFGAARMAERFGVESVPDGVVGIGPLGGLVGLLERAASSGALAIAVAVDMPYVSRPLLERLVTIDSKAPIVAPRRSGRWEPLFARYDAARVATIAQAHAASGKHSLQALLDASGAEELPLTENQWAELRDWDQPADMR